MIIITRGQLADNDKVIEQIVRATEHAISIIIVGVGRDNKKKFKDLEVLDGEEIIDENGKAQIQIVDKKGNRAKRDIVQFMIFREHKSDYF